MIRVVLKAFVNWVWWWILFIGQECWFDGLLLLGSCVVNVRMWYCLASSWNKPLLYGLLVSIYFCFCGLMVFCFVSICWRLWKSARNFERSKEILFIYIIIIIIYIQEKGKEKVGMSLEVVVIKLCLELWCYKSTSHYWFWCKITKKEDKYGLFKENILETFLIFCFISWTVTSFVCS